MKKFTAALLTIFVGFTIWYHIPTRHQVELNLSTFQGENKSVTILLDVKKHKSFISPTRLSGKIIYDGTVYESLKLKNGNKWTYKMQQKLNGELANTWFIDSSIEDIDFLRVFEGAESWNLSMGTDDLKKIILNYKKDGVSSVFAGQATNEEEAVKVALQLFGHE